MKNEKNVKEVKKKNYIYKINNFEFMNMIRKIGIERKRKRKRWYFLVIQSEFVSQNYNIEQYEKGVRNE